ncbi:MAG: hypothetical protein IE916_02180 [Epsilonproteobacteria bacterium]|nr:hypothetical protein [Campylobacterota bacterium]
MNVKLQDKADELKAKSKEMILDGGKKIVSHIEVVLNEAEDHLHNNTVFRNYEINEIESDFLFMTQKFTDQFMEAKGKLEDILTELPDEDFDFNAFFAEENSLLSEYSRLTFVAEEIVAQLRIHQGVFGTDEDSPNTLTIAKIKATLADAEKVFSSLVAA